jgi:hypothetical protein
MKVFEITILSGNDQTTPLRDATRRVLTARGTVARCH